MQQTKFFNLFQVAAKKGKQSDDKQADKAAQASTDTKQGDSGRTGADQTKAGTGSEASNDPSQRQDAATNQAGPGADSTGADPFSISPSDDSANDPNAINQQSGCHHMRRGDSDPAKTDTTPTDNLTQ